MRYAIMGMAAGALLLGLALDTGPATAGDPGQRGPRWQREGAPRELGSKECDPGRFLDLTDEQRDKIREIREAGREETRAARKELLRLDNEIEGEFLQDEPSRDKLRNLTERAGEIRTQLQLAHLDQRLAIRGLLTPEQRDRALLRKGGPGHGRHGMKGRRGGLHRGPGCEPPPGD